MADRKAAVLPDWLAQTEHRPLPPRRNHWLGGGDYLKKTLTDIQRILAEDMYAAGLTERSGLLQKLDPHVKLASIALLLAASALCRQLGGLAAINVLVFGLAAASRIRPGSYLLRVWLPAFLFGGIAVLPGIFSWITPGDAVLTLWSNLPFHIGLWNTPDSLAVTRQGLRAALFVLLRTAASLGLVMLLVKTTRWALLTKALGRFGVPVAIVAVLDLTYRYLFLFLFLLTDYILGRKSRLVAVERPLSRLAWTGAAIAGFLRMTSTFSLEITQAMQARGYTGEYRTEPLTGMNALDACFLGFTAIVLAGIWGGTALVQSIGL